MKLAEALQERADLNSRINELSHRIEQNVLVQENETPAEDPDVLMKELDADVERLSILMKQINLTNCTVKVENRTLTQIIAEKDALNLKINIYRSIAAEASGSTSRARGTEIKILPVVNISEIHRQIDNMAKQLRVLDNTLQSTNWSVDLIED